jgi:hypothetical protein
MRWVRCWRGAGRSRVKKCLSRKQKQNESQAENRVLEDLPGEAQPLAIAGESPREHRDAERDHDRKAEDPQDDDHLGILGREAHHARGSFLGPLEYHQLQRGGVGKRGAQQAVVERMAGLVRGERTEQGIAEQVKVADRI